MDSINSAISRYIYCIPGKWNIHLANGYMKHVCDLEQKDVLATDGPGINEIIELKDSKYKLVDDENKELRDDIKKIKTKNIIIEIVGGSLITALTYIIAFK